MRGRPAALVAIVAVLAFTVLPTASAGGPDGRGIEIPVPIPDPPAAGPPGDEGAPALPMDGAAAQLVDSLVPIPVPWSGNVDLEGIVGEIPSEADAAIDGALDPDGRTPDGTPGPVAGMPPLPAAPAAEAAMGLEVTAAVATAVYLSEGFRIRDLRNGLPLAALFSRLRRDRLLDHPIREKIYDAICARPGIHYRRLLRWLGVSNGTLAFHLQHLERAGFVQARRVRGRKHLYPSDLRPGAGEALVTDRQRAILDYLGAMPGASQREIVEALSLKRSNVSYHIGILRSLGLVETRRVGSRTRCFVRDE